MDKYKNNAYEILNVSFHDEKRLNQQQTFFSLISDLEVFAFLTYLET